MTTTEPAAGGAQFSTSQPCPGTWVVTVSGEIDIATSDRFEAVVAEAIGAEPDTLVFDLAGVRFMDSSGLGVMLTTIHRTAAVKIRAASPGMLRLLQISGVAQLFQIVP